MSRPREDSFHVIFDDVVCYILTKKSFSLLYKIIQIFNFGSGFLKISFGELEKGK